METEIGPTLREARIRRKVDLTEIEQQTKIRVRYLRALENEEWDLLPGPTYTRSFIRTYALALGLDGERLADDFRRQQEEATHELVGREPVSRPPRLPTEGNGSGLGPGLIGGLAVAALVAVLLVLGITRGGGDTGGSNDPAANGAAKKGKAKEQANAKKRAGVSIELAAKGEVWVCAIAADGTPVINGEILPGGSRRGPFRSQAFALAFGNGSVGLRVNGKPFHIEQTPSPIGYQVTQKRVRVLPEGSRPDCT